MDTRRGADCTSGFRCWLAARRSSASALERGVSNGYSFIVEMLFEASRRGCRIGEVPIIFVERRQGIQGVGRVLAESLICRAAAPPTSGGVLTRQPPLGARSLRWRTSSSWSRRRIRDFRETASARSWSRSPTRRATGARGAVVAPWHPLIRRRTRGVRGPLPFLQVRATAVAERLRLRGLHAGRRQGAGRRVPRRPGGASCKAGARPEPSHVCIRRR